MLSQIDQGNDVQWPLNLSRSDPMAVAAEIILTADEKKRLGKSIGSRKAAVRLQARSRIVLLEHRVITLQRTVLL